MSESYREVVPVETLDGEKVSLIITKSQDYEQDPVVTLSLNGTGAAAVAVDLDTANKISESITTAITTEDS